MSTTLGTWARRTPAAIVTMVCGFVYLATAARYVLGGDNGEYASIFAQGGVPHPSGYPLYVVYLRAMSWLPATSPAHGAALATALLGVATIAMIMLACRSWRCSRGASVLAAALLAFTASMWKLSTHAEVFVLNALVAMTIVAVASSGGLLRGTRRSVALAALAGIGLSGHHTIVLLAPIGLLGWARGLNESSRRSATVALSVFGLLAGLSPYLYFLAGAGGSTSRLEWGDTSSLGGLLHHFLRSDYGTFSLAISDEAATPAAHVWRLLHSLGTDLHYLPVAIIVVGAWIMLGARPRAEPSQPASSGVALPLEPAASSAPEDWEERPISGLHETMLRADLQTLNSSTVPDEPEATELPDRLESWCLAASFLLAGPLFVARFNLPLDGLSGGVVERFYLLPLILLVVPLARGVDALFGPWVRSINVVGPSAVALACLGIFVGYEQVREHHRPDVEYYLVNTLISADPTGVILGTGDHRLYGFWYLQSVRGHRPDVVYVDPLMLHYDWYRARIESELGFDLPPIDQTSIDTRALALAILRTGRPLYLTNRFTDAIVRSFATYPVGTLIRVLPPGEALPSPVALEEINVDLAIHYIYAVTAPRDPDGWAKSVQFAYMRPWRVLAEAYEAAGRPEDAERCRNRSIVVQPARALAPLRD